MTTEKALSRDEIHARIVEILADSFELEASEITGESTLYEDLDLDSIDAIDIFVALRDLTGRRPDPAEAREVRTVDELVTFVQTEIEKGPDDSDAEGGPPDASEILGTGGDGS